MRSLDLSGLIKGLLVLVGLAIALDKLDALRDWAIREAFSEKPYLHRTMGKN